MMTRGLRLGRVFGIPIELNVTWFLVFFLIAATFALGGLPLAGHSVVKPGSGLAWALGALAAVLLFGSILLHELAHSYVAVKFGIPVRRVTLFMFGGVSQLEREPERPLAEFLVAVAGPAASAVLAGVAYGLYAVFRERAIVPAAISYHLFYINGAVLVFNLVPAFPLDGGRIFRALLWALTKSFRKATLVAATLGRAFGMFLVVLGVAMPFLMRDYLVSGLWLIFIGLFLYQAAEVGYLTALYPHLLRPHRLREYLRLADAALEPSEPVALMVKRAHEFPYADAFPVMEEGRFRGVASLRNLAQIPPEGWATTRVADVVEEDAPTCLLDADSNVMEAVEKILHAPGCYYLLTDGERVLRVLSVHDVAELMRRLRDAGLLPPKA